MIIRPILLGAILLPMQWARADCAEDLERCQEVTLDVSACEFVTLDNRNEGAVGQDIQTVRGLRLTASALITYPSSCSLTLGSPKSASQQPNEFFYRTEEASGCRRFVGKTKAFWLVPRCCEESPRTGRCLPNETVLVDESPRYFPIKHW